MGTVLKDSAVVFVAVEVFRLELIDSLPSKLQNRSPWRRKESLRGVVVRFRSRVLTL